MFDPKVQSEYMRFAGQLEGHVEDVTETSISSEDVLRAHFCVVDYFYQHPELIKEDGGGIAEVGPKDLGMMISAVNRQFVSWEGKSKWADKYDICATLVYGLVKNHAFHDANKRTALLCMLYQMERAGRAFNCSQEHIEEFLVAVADDSIKKEQRYKELARIGHDPEVQYISWFLKRNTRQINHLEKVVTYQQLRGILRGFGYDIQPASKGFANVVKIEEKTSRRWYWPTDYMFDDKPSPRFQIVFTGWSKVVKKNIVKHVRKKCGLVANNSCDSGVFYGAHDSMFDLISQYQQPFINLARR